MKLLIVLVDCVTLLTPSPPPPPLTTTNTITTTTDDDSDDNDTDNDNEIIAPTKKTKKLNWNKINTFESSNLYKQVTIAEMDVLSRQKSNSVSGKSFPFLFRESKNSIFWRDCQ